MYSFAIIIVLITQIKQFIRIIKFKDAITYYLALFITLDKETRITNFKFFFCEKVYQKQFICQDNNMIIEDNIQKKYFGIFFVRKWNKILLHFI
jgi:hypothetical protein